MPVQLATVTGSFGAGVTGSPRFTPSSPVVVDGIELIPAQPITATIQNGSLFADAAGNPLELPMTSQGTPVGATGFWYWQVTGLPGIPPFGFYLTGNADISTLVNSPSSAAVVSVNGHGGVVVLAAADVGAVAKAGDTMAGHLAPKVVALTDAATIALDASAGNDFRVTLGGNRTLGAPSNPVDGQQITVTPKQDATGGRTLAFDPVYKFGAAGTPTITATANAADILGFKYYATPGEWRYLGTQPGF